MIRTYGAFIIIISLGLSIMPAKKYVSAQYKFAEMNAHILQYRKQVLSSKHPLCLGDYLQRSFISLSNLIYT